MLVVFRTHKNLLCVDSGVLHTNIADNQGCRNEFLHGGGGGGDSIFLPLRATSVIFWRFTPKPGFQKKIALLTEIKKNYLIRF